MNGEDSAAGKEEEEDDDDDDDDDVMVVVMVMVVMVMVRSRGSVVTVLLQGERFSPYSVCAVGLSPLRQQPDKWSSKHLCLAGQSLLPDDKGCRRSVAQRRNSKS